MNLKPISFKEATAFIKAQHRHHLPPQGWKWGHGVEIEGKLVGVATVGRPVARGFDDGYTAEVTRLCTDGSSNACSMLYSAAWRAAKAMGYKRILTYILEEESGSSVKAAGWVYHGRTQGGSWNCKSRPRRDKSPLCKKLRFVCGEWGQS